MYSLFFWYVTTRREYPFNVSPCYFDVGIMTFFSSSPPCSLTWTKFKVMRRIIFVLFVMEIFLHYNIMKCNLFYYDFVFLVCLDVPTLITLYHVNLILEGSINRHTWSFSLQIMQIRISSQLLVFPRVLCQSTTVLDG